MRWRTVGLPYGQLQCRTFWSSSILYDSQTIPQLPSNAELAREIIKSEEIVSGTRAIPENYAPPASSKTSGAEKAQSSIIRRMPQSPLTDPKLQAARRRYTEPKPLPRKEALSSFQKKLRKNPYGTSRSLGRNIYSTADNAAAQALASSTRQCMLTRARLPSYFLLDFGLQTHPETGAKWHLPRIAADAEADEQDEANEVPREEEHHIDEPAVVKSTREKTATPSLPSRQLSGAHLLSSHQTMSYMSSLRPARYRTMIPVRWKEDSAITLGEIVWREDMADFVLGILRKRVVQDLKYLASRPGFVVACKSWRNVQRNTQVGAVLWVGEQAAGDESEDKSENIRMDADASTTHDKGEVQAPPKYAMYLYRGHHIPIYNLTTILGSAKVSSLRESNPAHYGRKIAVIKQKNSTLRLQLELWRLLGYCANGDAVEDEVK